MAPTPKFEFFFKGTTEQESLERISFFNGIVGLEIVKVEVGAAGHRSLYVSNGRIRVEKVSGKIVIRYSKTESRNVTKLTEVEAQALERIGEKIGGGAFAFLFKSQVSTARTRGRKSTRGEVKILSGFSSPVSLRTDSFKLFFRFSRNSCLQNN